MINAFGNFNLLPHLMGVGYGISYTDTIPGNFKDEQIFNAILHKYTQQHRVYHTLRHIEDLATLYWKWCGTAGQNPTREMCLAILYHDVVYETGSTISSNESESARYFETHAALMHLPFEIVEVVNELILSTSPTANIPQTRLVDLDLLILAGSFSQYEHYAKGIRQEWQHLPDSIYVPERIKFLNSMLNKESIYKDDQFVRYNERAKNNIQREIKVLKTWGTPVGNWSEEITAVI